MRYIGTLYSLYNKQKLIIIILNVYNIPNTQVSVEY